MVTIKDVAERAGVAPSTVSHAFSGKRKISDAVKKRIFAIAREMDYHPNAAARSLKTRQTGHLGLCVDSEAMGKGWFFQRLLKGFSCGAAEKGYHVLLLTRQEGVPEHDYYMGIHGNGPVDGVLLTDPNINDTYMQKLIEREVPFVILGRPADAAVKHYVDNDNVAISLTVMEHLAALGHRRIAFINGPEDWTVSVDRLEGYRRASQSCGTCYDPSLLRFSNFTREGGYEGVRSLLRSGAEFTAVFAADDMMAIGACQALQEESLRVPQDVSIVGVNNDIIAQIYNPPLTTVEVHAEEMGEEAARMLIGLVEEDERGSSPVIVDAELIARNSSGRCRYLEPASPT